MPMITVTEENVGQRLDVFLVSHMGVSRSQIQKLIKSGDVEVNGEKAPTKQLTLTGDQIFYPEIELGVPQKTDAPPILDIVYQDNDLLVINKPAGLLVHDSNEKETRTTVVDGLLEIFPEVAEIGDDPSRPGIVHRLDKDVSGLMVIAKTQQAFDALKDQFKERIVDKEYLALVYGTLPKSDDIIKLKIARSRARGRMVARTQVQEGKEAVTSYSVIQHHTFTTYARVKILTGRTHQIRVHMMAIGHPIVGDKLYKIKRMKINPLDLDRIFLHARKLSFQLLDGTPISFEAPLPEELRQVLRTLK